ncbi:hypothetical protein AMEX_G8096 [Astyanax mexicanus]|uniref:Uncharacterized protein n=1 Tax=Astyanax mexicanus TaxID=7994 RepID=A0A8T2LWQ0_ASTMX|nr:hypothetical protein AMEX_G8096 [Astyanax mexicanus]
MLVFKLRAADRILRFLFLYFLLLLLFSLEPLVAELNNSCIVKWHPNGTIYTLTEHVVSGEDFSWLVDDIVKANEDNLDPTMVHSRGPRFIVLYSCQTLLSYRSTFSVIPWNCFTSCPITPAPKDAGNLRAVIAGCSAAGVVVLCALVLLGVLWWKKDRLKRYFHPETAAVPTCAYSAAESGVSSPS